MSQAQLHGRGDKVLQIPEKTAQVRANGFRVRRLADDLSICGAAESIQKLPEQKAYVASDTLDIYLVCVYCYLTPAVLDPCRNEIAICKRRPRIFSAGNVLSLHLYHRFRHSIEFKILPIYKVVILYGFHRLYSRRIVNSNDILVSVL